MLAVAPIVATAIATAAPCAHRVPAHVPPSHWTAARHVIAPHGASAVRLCRYAGLDDPHPGRLARHVGQRRAKEVRRLVSRLDALPPATGPYSCPSDDGSAVVAHLAYPDGHRVAVFVSLSGCRIATNGHVSGLGTSALVRQLRRLTA